MKMIDQGDIQQIEQLIRSNFVNMDKNCPRYIADTRALVILRLKRWLVD